MPRDSQNARSDGLKIARLLVAAHVHALTQNPVQYVLCCWWWLTGKRLRARLKIAPMLGQSKYAYDLWQVRHEVGEEVAPNADGQAARILALVAGAHASQTTLANLRQEGIEPLVIRSVEEVASINLSTVEWILPISSGDQLARGAGEYYRSAASSASTDTFIIYGDDDLIDAGNNRSNPHFKPDWNAELFQHFDFLTGAAILRASVLDLDDLDGDDWAAALTRQAVDLQLQATADPIHLRRVLHHREKRPCPALPLEPVVHANSDRQFPSVSVLVPTRDQLGLLCTCLEGLKRTDYPARLEIIVIDNGSTETETLDYLSRLPADFAKVLRDDSPFNFAALNNRAAKMASGEVFCFLNNDIEIMDSDWLTTMVDQAMRDEVGAVGARLLYPDGKIQHAGVVLGIGGAAAHAHRLLDPEEEGYFHRHSLPQYVSAVTAACMIMRRECFEAVGGFDEERFAVSFNDVDLCLRLREKGWKNLYEPRATLIHHESVSRGLDRDPIGAARQAREVEALQERWQTGPVFEAGGCNRQCIDPFHHPELSPLSEQFVLRI